MDWWQAAVLGIVEGLTEYLPVSSTGHLILTQRLLNITDGPGVRAFEIVIQAGAILAVVGVYAGHVKKMLLGLVGRSPDGLRLGLLLLIAFLPAALLGLALEKYIDKANLTITTIAWFVGGVAILGFERWRSRVPGTGRGVGELSLLGALGIGLIQSLALCPGISRSLVCLVGGLLVSLRFAAALEFSFLLGGLTLTVASAYKGIKYRHEILHEVQPLALAIGLIFAALAAFATVRWMLSSLGKYGLAPFGWYRIALAAAVGSLLAAGRL